ncbi:NUDIX hydrolase [Elioraea sp.]|uniref:NUDIX hydrolase n=1 Tax=Elioraea sp. TaxID=2185103 RepID=UPI003F6FD7B0
MTSAPPPPRLVEYLALRETHPSWFRNPDGGIEVLLDPAGIMAVEAEMGRRYAARGLPEAWAEVGIRYRDPYLMLLCDAVRFPGGEIGVHHRVVRAAGDLSGVAMLPRLPDRRLVLVRHFRHATRAWHWEVPRGGIEPGFDAEHAARAELAEEIGATVTSLTPLGAVHGSTGLLGLAVQLYLAEVSTLGAPALNEGITELRAFAVAEVEVMVSEGELTDAYSLACLLRARLRGLL